MHSSIYGRSGSGKTTLAILMCHELLRRGHEVGVLDNMTDERWKLEGYELAIQTTNKSEFVKFAKKNKGLFLFVDEGSDEIGRNPPPEIQWLATKSRHFGHSVTFISQAATQMSNVVRAQCSNCYIFKCGEKMKELLAEELCEPELKNAHQLGPGEFLAVREHKGVYKGRVDFKSQSCYNVGKMGEMGG